jgi:hypothetical protein
LLFRTHADEDLTMHRLVKAMTVAGMIAAGSPLLIEAADAQQVPANNWYEIKPVYCYTTPSMPANVFPVGPATTPLFIWAAVGTTSFMTVTVPDSSIASAMLKLCYDGSAFYGWFDGRGWSEFWITPGLK